MRFEPGALTIAYDHGGVEDCLILEDDLTESDGTVFGAGGFVSDRPGTHHRSSSDGAVVASAWEGASLSPVGAGLARLRDAL